jgi:hypothetical protein
VSYDEEGEVELDLSKVDYPSLSDVDAYIRQVKGMPPRELPARRNAPAATEPSDGDGMRSRGVVRAEQVRGCSVDRCGERRRAEVDRLTHHLGGRCKDETGGHSLASRHAPE